MAWLATPVSFEVETIVLAVEESQHAKETAVCFDGSTSLTFGNVSTPGIESRCGSLFQDLD